MNLKQARKKLKVTKLSVDYDGNKIDFCIKPLTGGDKNKLLKEIAGLTSINDKVNIAKEKGETYSPNGDELVQGIVYNQMQAYFSLCDENGVRTESDFNKFIDTTESGLLDKICKKISEHINPETKEEIEKN